jgi:hypothetical protein
VKTPFIPAVDVQQIVQDAAMKYFDPTSEFVLMQQPQIWLEVFRNVFGRDPISNDDGLWEFLFDRNGLSALHRFCQPDVMGD